MLYRNSEFRGDLYHISLTEKRIAMPLTGTSSQERVSLMLQLSSLTDKVSKMPQTVQRNLRAKNVTQT